MESVDVANMIISRYADRDELTNLKLNKLVYFAQAVSLRTHGTPLFDDEIQAWAYGPVEPLVYRTFSHYGRNVIRRPSGEYETSPEASEIVRTVMASFGRLTAFDLVRLSHRAGSAWKSVYRPNANAAITPNAILESRDGVADGIMNGTLAGGVEKVRRTWPNAMRMLENS